MLQLFDRLNLTPSERRLVVIIATVAVVVLNYWLVWPRFKDYGEIQEDLKTMQRRLTIFENEIGRKPAYELALRKLQEAGSALSAGEERIQFLTDMQRMARDVGLMVPRWGEVLPERGGSATNANAFFEAIGLTMNQVTGTESQFVDFLYRVGASNSTIRVKELTLVPGNFDARAQGKTNLIATIKLVASVQKTPALPVAGSPSVPAATPTPATAPTPVVRPPASTSSASSNPTPNPIQNRPSPTPPRSAVPRSESPSVSAAKPGAEARTGIRNPAMTADAASTNAVPGAPGIGSGPAPTGTVGSRLRSGPAGITAAARAASAPGGVSTSAGGATGSGSTAAGAGTNGLAVPVRVTPRTGTNTPGVVMPRY